MTRELLVILMMTGALAIAAHRRLAKLAEAKVKAGKPSARRRRR